jgi:hypothetical protein
LRKLHHRSLSRQLLIASIFSVAVAACSGPNELGMDLLPTGDIISVGSKIDTNISAYIFRDDSVRTDETTRSLIGSILDPDFGQTTINMACQFRLDYHPDFTQNIEIDSFFLFLYYKNIYGDTLTSQHLKIYELANPINVDSKYYAEEDLKSYAGNKVLADFSFVPKRTLVLDSIYKTYDTLYQYIKIPLDYSLARKIMAADSTTLSNNDLFLQYFKGIYIETENVASGGTIVALDMLSNADINGSALVMYFRQTNPADGSIDTTDVALTVSSFSARVNNIKHNYAGSSFAGKIDNEKQEPDKLYLQSTSGLKSKIYIPDLDTWKDSVNVAVNKAELIFTVDSLASNPTKWEPPKQLFLTIIDSIGKEYLPIDYTFSSSYYGGALDTTDYTYRFNITQHLQEVVDGKFKNNGFYLSVGDKTSEYKRVILNGSASDGIKLNIAYSKINQ